MKCRRTIPGDRGRVGRLCLTPVARPLPPSLAVLAVCCLLSAPALHAQDPELEHRARMAVSQNVADYIFLGTLNAEIQYSVHRNWTLGLGARYNNWTWRQRQDTQFEARQQTYYLDGRWWPWYTYSGWWVRSMLQAEVYNRQGMPIWQDGAGQAWGLSLGAGYSLMLTKWLNLDLGAGVWGGKRGLPGEEQQWFWEPEMLTLGLMFVF